jgi:uncharacterized protein (DUF433 family)
VQLRINFGSKLVTERANALRASPIWSTSDDLVFFKQKLMKYVEKKNGSYRLIGTRVSLDSIVIAFLSGQTPESITQSFPTLNLEQVYGAITYYLAHRSEVDEYLARCRTDFEKKREAARDENTLLNEKLADARRRLGVKQP